jgi:replicative DNA helicase
MIVARLVGGEANIKPSRIMAGLLTDKEVVNKNKAQAHLTAYNELMAFEDSLYSLPELKKSIQENEFDFVVIDFVQNILAKGSEYETMSMASIELQKLAKTCNCCILVLSQLSNDAHKTGNLEYKGSGGIATVCDLGMFLVKDPDDFNKLKIIVKKNRRGRSGIEINLISTYPGGKIYENNRD